MSVPLPAILVAIVIMPGPACVLHDVRFALVLFRIQHLVLDLAPV